MGWIIWTVLVILLMALIFIGLKYALEITLAIIFCIFALWVIFWLIPAILKSTRG